MKKISIIFLMTISLASFGQKFAVTPTGLKNSEDNEKAFVVIEVAEKTAKQLYDNSLKYVNQTYENPSEVIKGNTEAEYLSFDTYAPSFLYIKNGGVKIFFNAKFKTEIHFKDNKVKYEIISLEIINDANGMPLKFTGGGLDWMIYNKKGVLKREKAKEELETYFNNQLLNLTKYLKEETEEDNW